MKLQKIMYVPHKNGKLIDREAYHDCDYAWKACAFDAEINWERERFNKSKLRKLGYSVEKYDLVKGLYIKQ